MGRVASLENLTLGQPDGLFFPRQNGRMDAAIVYNIVHN